MTEPVLTMARARFHLRHGRLRHVEIAVEIGLQRLIEMLLGAILERETCTWKAALLTRTSSCPIACTVLARRPSKQKPAPGRRRRRSGQAAAPFPLHGFALVTSASAMLDRGRRCAMSAPSRANSTANRAWSGRSSVAFVRAAQRIVRQHDAKPRSTAPSPWPGRRHRSRRRSRSASRRRGARSEWSSRGWANAGRRSCSRPSPAAPACAAARPARAGADRCDRASSTAALVIVAPGAGRIGILARMQRVKIVAVADHGWRSSTLAAPRQPRHEPFRRLGDRHCMSTAIGSPYGPAGLRLPRSAARLRGLAFLRDAARGLRRCASRNGRPCRATARRHPSGSCAGRPSSRPPCPLPRARRCSPGILTLALRLIRSRARPFVAVLEPGRMEFGLLLLDDLLAICSMRDRLRQAAIEHPVGRPDLVDRCAAWSAGCRCSRGSSAADAFALRASPGGPAPPCPASPWRCGHGDTPRCRSCRLARGDRARPSRCGR